MLSLIGIWENEDEVLGVVLFDIDNPPIYYLCKSGCEYLYEEILELKCDSKNLLQYTLPNGFTITYFEEERDFGKYKVLLYKGFDHEGEEEADLTYESVLGREPHWNDSLKIIVKAPTGEWCSH